MSVLTEGFPVAVEIDGKEYPLNTDFRVGLTIITAFEDPALSPWEKLRVMLELLYQEIPENTEEAQRLAVMFLDAQDGRESEGKAVHQERLYSFTQDAGYIYSAIRQTHGIDLEEVDLHWWKFRYLFLDIGENTMFSKILSLRLRKQKGTLTDEEKKEYRTLRDILELPEKISQEDQQQLDEFERLLQEGGGMDGG